MKSRSTFTALFMLLAFAAIGQTSAYQCLPWEPPISQGQTFSANSVFRQNCIQFDEAPQYLYQQAYDIQLEAYSHIVIEPGFQAGLMQPNGSMSMQLAQQPTGYDVFLMSGTSMAGLPRYKKVEFGVQLADALHDRIEAFVHPDPNNTATPPNPYLESKLDVQTVFTHESGSQRKIDAFYFQDFNRNMSSYDWDEVQTEHPMRLRFTPHLNGKWTARTSVKVENVLVANLLPYSFTVVESGKPGFVSVHPNTRNLQRANRIIYPVGTNFPSPYDGVDIWPWNGGTPAESNKAAKVDDWLHYHQLVVDYAEKGGKYIRTLQSAYSSLIEFENLGDYSNRLHYAWEQDKLLETCEDFDLLMQFNLMQQEPTMKYANYGMSRWDFGLWDQQGNIDGSDGYPPYCYYTYPNKEPMEMYTDPVDLEYHKQRTRYYISRYGYSPQIYAFELVNEPFHLGEISGGSSVVGDLFLSGATQNAIETYHTTIADYIKNGLGHINHLVGISMMKVINTYEAPLDINSMDTAAWHPAVDYVSYNPYADAPDKLIITKEDNDNLGLDYGENSYYARNRLLHMLLSKPVLFSETGHVLENTKCSQNVGHYKDVMSFGFTGIAGFNMWAGWGTDWDGGEDQTFLQKSTIRAQNHMNGNDVIFTLIGDANNSGHWKQGREYEKHDNTPKMKEHQYYVSSDKLKAVGYIYNRTHNRFTNQNPPDCVALGPIPPNGNGDFNTWVTTNWHNKKMKVHGLKKYQWYRIDLYTYKKGLYWDSKCVKSNGAGKLELEHEPMDPGVNPVLWYVIHRDNCNNNKTLEEGAENPALAIDPSLSLAISPNPSAGILNLQIEAEEGKAVSLQIFNVHGQEVYSNDQVFERQLTLDTGLKSGIYLIKIADGQNEQTKKFIVQ